MDQKELGNALSTFLSMETDEFFDILSGETTDEYISELENLYAKFEKNNNPSKKATTKEVGDALENLVKVIGDSTNLFEVYSNQRTSTNEIDHLFISKPQAKQLIQSHVFSEFENMIIECKNYNKKVGVTWVGKLYSLLKASNCNVGVLFSYHGLTGNKNGWNAAVGLTKKIYLKDEILILDFNNNDINRLVHGESFLKLVREKIQNLKFDTQINYEQHEILLK